MQHERLTPASIISTLLSGFPSSQNTDVDGQMMAYLVAIEGYTLTAMVQATKAFLTGKVKRGNATFAPSAPEFAEQVRLEQLTMEAADRPRIEEKPPEPPAKLVDPRKLKLLNAALQGDVTATEELKRMYPDLPVWRMADLPVSKLMESE